MLLHLPREIVKEEIISRISDGFTLKSLFLVGNRFLLECAKNVTVLDNTKSVFTRYGETFFNPVRYYGEGLEIPIYFTNLKMVYFRFTDRKRMQDLLVIFKNIIVLKPDLELDLTSRSVSSHNLSLVGGMFTMETCNRLPILQINENPLIDLLSVIKFHAISINSEYMIDYLKTREELTTFYFRESIDEFHQLWNNITTLGCKRTLEREDVEFCNCDSITKLEAKIYSTDLLYMLEKFKNITEIRLERELYIEEEVEHAKMFYPHITILVD